MLDQLWNYVALAGLLLVLVVLWATSIRAVFADTHRRHLSSLDSFYWVALAICLPLVGALVYVTARVADWLILASSAQQAALDEDFPSTGGTGGTGGPLLQPEEYLPAPYYPEIAPAPPAGKTQPPAERVGQRTNGGQRSGSNGGSHNNPHLEEKDTRPVRPDEAPHIVQVFIIEGPEAGRSVQISRLPALIGRSAQAQVRIEIDPALSRQHAELYWGADGLRIRDLSSLHGTLVNGVRQVDQPVRPGDRIEVGFSILVIELPKGGL